MATKQKFLSAKMAAAALMIRAETMDTSKAMAGERTRALRGTAMAPRVSAPWQHQVLHDRCSRECWSHGHRHEQ